MARERERESGNDRVRKFWVFLLFSGAAKNMLKVLAQNKGKAEILSGKRKENPKMWKTFFEVVPINCAVPLWG